MKICPDCQTQYSDDIEFCAQDGMKLRPIKQAGDDPIVGQTLEGRWIVESKIGEGGMGSVYKGKQRSVNRQVAIKTLRAALADNDEFVDRFFREAKIATTINHPHCVTVLDFGQTTDGTLFLAMEFLDGQELTDKLKAGGLTQEQILKIAIQIASALSAAHSHNIIHRDLKPDNIFLLNMSTGEVFAKVLDFGIAKVSDGNTQYTRTGQIFGTPEYMSPEQCSGLNLDGRSDLYSLGCILYEVVTGRTPFQGNNPMSILMGHVSGELVTPSTLGIQVWPPLEAIIVKLMQKEPSDRYANADSLIAALKDALSNLEGQTALRRSQGFTGSIVPPTTPSGGLPVMDTMAQVTPTGLDHLKTPAPLYPSHSEPFSAPYDDDLDAPPTTPNRRNLLIGAAALVAILLVGSAFAIVKLTGNAPKDADVKPTEDKIAASAATSPTTEPSAPAADPTPDEQKNNQDERPAQPESVPQDEAPTVDPSAEPTAEPETPAEPAEPTPDAAAADPKKTKTTKRSNTKSAPKDKADPAPVEQPKEPKETKETKPTKTTKTKKLDGIIDDLNL